MYNQEATIMTKKKIAARTKITWCL